jgi:acyl-CoA thioesterase YciA
MSAKPSDALPPHGPATPPTDKESCLKVIPDAGRTNGTDGHLRGLGHGPGRPGRLRLPARIIRGRMATVAVNQFVFKQPVRVGDILSFFAAVERIGRTSVTVDVEVYSESFRDQGQFCKVTEASLTYVAIDENGRPKPIPR